MAPFSMRNDADAPAKTAEVGWRRALLKDTWPLLKDTFNGFFEDEALTRGAAISFYTVTSIGPVLFIVVAIAGLAFGRQAATGAISAQLAGLMGQQSAAMLQSAIQGAEGTSSGVLATAFGIAMLLVTASGVFTEMQQSLNVIWKAAPSETTISGLFRARALSLGLVCGF
jgi:membrane protein